VGVKQTNAHGGHKALCRVPVWSAAAKTSVAILVDRHVPGCGVAWLLLVPQMMNAGKHRFANLLPSDPGVLLLSKEHRTRMGRHLGAFLTAPVSVQVAMIPHPELWSASQHVLCLPAVVVADDLIDACIDW
jgi:hypothetical protein